MRIVDEAIKEAAKSTCLKRKVGAIIINKYGTIVSRGHNKPGLVGTPCENAEGNTLASTIHAEIDALSTLYDTAYKMYVTHQPCNDCLKAIKAKGLEYEVVQNFMKFDTNKLRYSLIPTTAMEAMASVLTYGAKKYKADNWKLVDDDSRYIDALYRHLEAWRAGENTDSESGLSHLSHAITNMAFLIYLNQQK